MVPRPVTRLRDVFVAFIEVVEGATFAKVVDGPVARHFGLGFRGDEVDGDEALGAIEGEGGS